MPGVARLRAVWLGALACFVLAGLTGALLRFWLVSVFPGWANYANARHAHSHLMYFGWVTPALMAVIAARLPDLTGRPLRPGAARVGATLLVLSLLTYAAFFLWGYQPAEIAGRSLPISMILSSLHIFPWLVFIWIYWRSTRRAPRSRPLKLWDAALVFILLASLGAWGRALMAVLKVSDPFLTTAAVHLFLDLFSEGWFVLALLGLAYASNPGLSRTAPGWADRLVIWGLPVTFLLGLPIQLVPASLRAIAGAGGIMVALGLLMHLRTLLPALSSRDSSGWPAPLLFLGLKAILLIGVALPPVAAWAEPMGLRLFYLHVLLLGFVTLGLFAAARRAWGGQFVPAQGWMEWAVALLLVSLIPLTGLWPAELGGRWRLALAAWAALGPVLAALYFPARGVIRKFSQAPGA